jgi:tRNA pseudouridine65 synthase
MTTGHDPKLVGIEDDGDVRELQSGAPEAPLEILYRDNTCVAICKPSGLLVHRSRMDATETVFAVQRLRDQLGQRVHPVHRLDKSTSGVLVFAFDPRSAGLLNDQFESGSVRKRYLALVRGWLQGSGRVDYPLRRETDRYSRERLAVVQDAITDWQSIATGTYPRAVGRYAEGRYSLVELEPRTGRKHQIRRHLAHLRHPVIGDSRHGDGAHNRFFREQFGISRLLLHAWCLEFSSPETNHSVVVRAPLPEVFRTLMSPLGMNPSQPFLWEPSHQIPSPDLPQPQA